LTELGLPLKRIKIWLKNQWKPVRWREKTVAKYAEKRKALLEAGDFVGLQITKNASPVRFAQCKITGRPRGYMRQFGVSRYILNGK
jgi:hypothetical protein